jgi:hypothetical protein
MKIWMRKITLQVSQSDPGVLQVLAITSQSCFGSRDSMSAPGFASAELSIPKAAPEDSHPISNEQATRYPPAPSRVYEPPTESSRARQDKNPWNSYRELMASSKAKTPIEFDTVKYAEPGPWKDRADEHHRLFKRRQPGAQIKEERKESFSFVGLDSSTKPKPDWSKWTEWCGWNSSGCSWSWDESNSGWSSSDRYSHGVHWTQHDCANEWTGWSARW